jgi:radical SAM superfamily enzyme YgiQ (UPF0313 family)
MRKVRIYLGDLQSDLKSPPYQLGLLAAYASVEEEVAKTVDFIFGTHPKEQQAGQIAQSIMTAEPDLVAMSNYAWNYKKICEVLGLLAAADTPPRVLLGGPNCAGRFGAEMMRRYPVISAMVEGEGEPAFHDICTSLAEDPGQDPFLSARNCRLRDADGEVTSLNLGHRIEVLDEVPSPYLTGLLPVRPSPVFYETNRGCPYRCAFCYWGNGNSKIYRMSHERIQEEMTFLARHRVSSLMLADANFGMFPDDVEIAEMLAELNARHGYPFRYLGVNYAKNSSERVLDIAAILRRGRIVTTTTLALQSVTPEAEKRSKRYAVDPYKFIQLVRPAQERNISTYTDLILGMPGETIEEFLLGLEAAISTGIPAIKIHQLSLLPGTDFHDQQQALGLVLMPEAGRVAAPPGQRSEFWDFLIHSHPKMSHDDLKRGLRLVGINHLLHNHNLGKIVNFYLARYGVMPRQVHNFFDDLLLDQVKDFPAGHERLLTAFRRLILTFADAGFDAFTFESELSIEVWFAGRGVRADANVAEVSRFMHSFYDAFCHLHGICQDDPAGLALVHQIVEYNVLVSPKPRWHPGPAYVFTHDVDAIWRDMRTRIVNPRKKEAGEKGKWREVAGDTAARLRDLLTDEYLASQRGPVSYTVDNPMPFIPRNLLVAWAVTNSDWFCRMRRIDQS